MNVLNRNMQKKKSLFFKKKDILETLSQYTTEYNTVFKQQKKIYLKIAKSEYI